MPKYARFAIIAALLASMPSLAMAREARNSKSEDAQARASIQMHSEEDHSHENHHAVAGTITAVGTDGFTLKAKDNISYTVKTASTKFMQVLGMKINLAGVRVDDRAVVQGSIKGTTIDAEKIVITPAHTHKAKAKGTITAVGADGFTIQMNNQGVISSVNIATSASTTFSAASTSAVTLADVKVGARVKIKGLWDEIANVLRAFRVRIWSK